MLVPNDCRADSERLDCRPPEYYLRVYSILLGDWGLFEREEDFESKPTALLVFVAFSFFIAIVLLNVLIAIISDSYKQCLYRSRHLFGRSRVFLLSELVAFRNIRIFHEKIGISGYKNWHPMHWVHLINSVDWQAGGARSLLICSFGMILFWCISELFGVSKAYSDHHIMTNILKICGTFAINCISFMIFLHILSGKTSNIKGNKLCRFITWLMLCLLGEGSKEIDIDRDDSIISLQFNNFAEKMAAMVTDSETRILREMMRVK